MTTDPQPAAKPKRRWPQFSLRTLLIGTAVVLVGFTLRWIALAQRQRAVVVWVEQIYGSVQYHSPDHEPRLVSSLRHWLPYDYFDDVRGVLLSGTEVTDSDLLRLKPLTALWDLHLYKTQVTDAGLVHLKRLTSLENLYLDDTQVTDAGLEHLTGLGQLQRLHVQNSQVTSTGVEKLQKALPNCKIRH